MNNGSIFIHSIIIPTDEVPADPSFRELVADQKATYIKSRLTKYALPASAMFNLLKENNKYYNVKPVAHLHSKYSILLCTEKLNLPHSNLPKEILGHLRITKQREFLPIVTEDMLNIRLRDLIEIEPKSKNLNFTFTYKPASLGKLRFLLQMHVTLKQFLEWGFTEKDLDEVKGVFADTNLFLLCATFFVGSVHVGRKILYIFNTVGPHNNIINYLHSSKI